MSQPVSKAIFAQSAGQPLPRLTAKPPAAPLRTVYRGKFRGPPGGDLTAFDGALPGEPAEIDEMTVEKQRIGPYRIYRVWARTASPNARMNPIIGRRTHGAAAFWFMRHGRMTLVHSGRRYVAARGELAVTSKTLPFSYEFASGEDARLELAVLTVPLDLFGGVERVYRTAGRSYPTTSGDLRIAGHICEVLCENPKAVDADIAEQLIALAVEALQQNLEGANAPKPPAPSITARRLSDIQRYVSQHFSNPTLSAKTVAASCGISVRYLCYILNANGLLLSDIVWDRRISTARDWLRDHRMRRRAITEIAYLAGFKSPAHFSRVFKERYGLSPRDFRNMAETRWA